MQTGGSPIKYYSNGFLNKSCTLAVFSNPWVNSISVQWCSFCPESWAQELSTIEGQHLTKAQRSLLEADLSSWLTLCISATAPLPVPACKWQHFLLRACVWVCTKYECITFAVIVMCWIFVFHGTTREVDSTKCTEITLWSNLTLLQSINTCCRLNNPTQLGKYSFSDRFYLVQKERSCLPCIVCHFKVSSNHRIFLIRTTIFLLLPLHLIFFLFFRNIGRLFFV